MTPEAVRKALEAGVRAMCDGEYPDKTDGYCKYPSCGCRYPKEGTYAAIAAFLRALPKTRRVHPIDIEWTPNSTAEVPATYAPHDLAAAVDAASTTREEGT